MSKQIEVISRVFIINDGEVLLCKVKSKKNWFFPGGHIEIGENAEEALRRELQEEIGAELKNVNFIGVCENTFTFLGEEHQEINIVFEAEIVSNNFDVLEDHMEFGWFPIDKINSMNVLPEQLAKQFPSWLENKKSFYIK